MNVYAEDGVNRAFEDSASSFAGTICRATYANSSYIEVATGVHKHFRGPRMFRLKNLPADCWMDAGADGIGTLCLLPGHVGMCREMASHLVAMTFGDMTRHGRLPLMLLTNQLDVGSVGADGSRTRLMYQELLQGLKDLADEQSFVVYKGETAQMGEAIGALDPDDEFKFLWSGTVLGAAHPEKEITGEALYPGHVLVALREVSFRGCGVSSARAALTRAFGPRYWEDAAAQQAMKAVAAPAVLYDRFLADMHGWFCHDLRPRVRMSFIGHLSGGSLKSKIGEDVLFSLGLSADLADLWDPPSIMRQCKIWRGMTDEECYNTWNCGQGVLVAVEDKSAADFLIQAAERYDIDARVCGSVLHRAQPLLRIASKFTEGKMVEFAP